MTAAEYNQYIKQKQNTEKKQFVSESYSKTFKDWVEIGDKKIFVRSGWEANWGRYLDFLKTHGKITDWEYEPDTFYFEGIKRGTNNYTPDFKVTYPDGSVIFHEVKGYMDPKSATKLKRMAKYHPQVVMEVIDKKRYSSVKKSVGSLIKGWRH